MAVAGESSDEDGLGRWQLPTQGCFRGSVHRMHPDSPLPPTADKPAHELAAAAHHALDRFKRSLAQQLIVNRPPLMPILRWIRQTESSIFSASSAAFQARTNKKDGSMRIMNAPPCTRVLVADP